MISSLRRLRVVAQEALPLLLVLYPLLLLLDSLEPGFVRSVVNPHAFLLVLLGAGMLAGPDDAPRAVPARTNILVAVLAGVAGGLWAQWAIGGRFGIPIALLTGVTIIAVVLSMNTDGSM